MRKLFNAAENERRGKLFNFRPVLFTAAFFALGIVFSYARFFHGASLWWLLLALPVLVPTLLFSARRGRALLRAAFLFLVFSVGCLAFSAELGDFRSADYYEGEYTVIGTVTEKSDYGNFSRVVFSSLRIDGKETKGKLVAYLGASLSEKVSLGDRALLTGEVETDTAVFGEYGFKSGEITQRIYYRASVSSLTVAGRTSDAFLLLRERMRRRIYAGMDEEPASVTYALLTGDTSGIEEGLLQSVRRGGVAHIFAVSGLHVGALYAFCLFLIKKAKLYRLPKPVRFLLVSAILLFYGGVCGFSPSVVRASVMCLLFYASSLVGVKSDLLESVGAAALLLLLLRPAYLFDVGFGLSFAACLSIGALSPSLRRFFDAALQKLRLKAPPVGGEEPDGIFARMQKAVVSFLSVTISAQAGTLPVLLSSFGYISVWGLLLNCVFVPIVGAVFSLLLALVLFACLLPAAAAPVLLYVPSTLWSAALLVFHAADLSFVLSGFRMGGATALYYAFFIACSDKLRLGPRKKFLLALLLFAAFAGGMAAINGQTRSFLSAPFPLHFFFGCGII